MGGESGESAEKIVIKLEKRVRGRETGVKLTTGHRELIPEKRPLPLVS